MMRTYKDITVNPIESFYLKIKNLDYDSFLWTIGIDALSFEFDNERKIGIIHIIDRKLALSYDVTIEEKIINNIPTEKEIKDFLLEIIYKMQIGDK